MDWNNNFLTIDENLQSLIQNFIGEMSLLPRSLTEIENNFEKSILQVKEDLFIEISKHSAINAGVDLNALLKQHVTDPKKDFQSSLSENFQHHKN